MVQEFTVHPKPQNKNSRIVFLILFLVSVLGFVTYLFMDRYRGLVGFASVLVLVLALLVYTKYISVEFYYDIALDSEGVPMFVVRQTIGKRQTTLCRLDLADILKIEKESASERRDHKTDYGVVKYIYAPTMNPPISYRMTVSSRYEKAEVIIECNDDFAHILKKYSAEARALRQTIDDNE